MMPFCLICDNTRQVCDICGESEPACECPRFRDDDVDPDTLIATFSPCPNCNGELRDADAPAPTITIPGWIPVSERLPEFPPGEPTYNNSAVHVICAFPGGRVRAMVWERNWTAKREKNREPRWHEAWNRVATSPPTHWMAMPPAPTEATTDA